MNLTDVQAQEAITIALAPEEGQPFEYGGKAFTRQFLSAAAEQALHKLLMPRLQKLDEKSTLQDVYEAIFDLLPQACGIILSDQDPEADYAWVQSRKGRGMTMKQFEIVTATFEMNDLGKLFASFLGGAAMLKTLIGL